ncbi:hypothetical protein AKJ09_05878 [Labilithrix luteola]|uniref:Uncharacterized protein n=1 Tax=Labilithrix luteola TaxID=1391654 RepID=A0A0K1Q1E6_9BACT|nr:hypothetical protein AKJ09_05878 [Labilithrix luteola]
MVGAIGAYIEPLPFRAKSGVARKNALELGTNNYPLRPRA